jgi:ferric-dicitrate binding protein FerR (iron transport regulator)
MNKNEDINQDLIDYIKKEADTDQIKRVEKWIGENESHRKEYRRLINVFYKVKSTAKWDRINQDKGRNVIENYLKKQRKLQIFRYAAVAASVALLISFGLVFYVNHLEKEMKQLPLSKLSSPGEFKASLILSNGETIVLSENTRDSLSDAGKPIDHEVDEGINYQSKAETVVDSLVYNILKVARGEEYKVVLADGSMAWLNSESELKYPVAFIGNKREVFVKGEVYFEVTSDKEKEFIVHAADVQTKVLGTEFNVMAYDDEENIEVTLVEGKVNVKAGTENKTILPGKQIAIDRGSLAMKENAVDTKLYSSWKDGIIYFDEMSMEKLCQKLSRWYNIDFVFEEERLKYYAFTGAVKKKLPIEFTLDFLRTTSNLKFTVQGKRIIVFEVKHRK